MKRIFTQLTASLLLMMAGVLIFPISAPAATDDETKSYQIKMNVNEGGKVVTSATQAPEGSSVSLWTYVKKGYQRETFTVTTSDGQDVELIPIVGTSTTELLTNGKCDGTFGGWEKTDAGSGWKVNTEKNQICWASSYQTCTLWQTFNLEDYGISDSEIDKGNVACSASADMMSIWEKNGQGARVAEVKVEMQDASGNVIKTVTVLDDLSYIEDWKSYNTTFNLVNGTRKLKYVVRGQDAIIWNGNFGPAYRNLSLTITSTGSESGFTMPAADVTVNAVFSKEGGGTVVTPEPTITYETTDDYCLITATGEGEVKLYVDGTEIENPCMWDRTDQDQTVTVTATAQEDGKEMSTVTLQIKIPKKEGGTTAPTISYEITDDYCLITATGEGMIILYVNDTEVENPCMWDRTDQDQEITVTAVDEINGNVVTEAIWIPKKEGGSAFTGKVCIDNIYYNLNGDDKTAEVTYNVKYEGYIEGDLVIPEKVTYEGVEYTVTSIGESAFYSTNYVDPTSVKIPGTVTTIREYAFRSCDFRIIEIPEGVTTIGKQAFYSCTYCHELYLPSTLTSIGSQAFGWGNLTKVFSSTENPCELPEDAFDEDRYQAATLGVPVGAISNYQNTNYWNKFQKIVETETIAGADGKPLRYYLYSDSKTAEVAHMDYSGKIVIPEKVTIKGVEYTVTTIGEEAFYECEDLTSVSIPGSVTTIADFAFYACSGLSSITIPGSVTTIGYSAFDSCSGLTSITIPGSVTTIDNYAFYDCSGLTSITIPEGVTTIGKGVFGNCSGLTSITIPNSVTTIGYHAFRGCSGLTSITIPGSVTTIDNYAFLSCSGLTSITIPASVTTLGVNPFEDCSRLASMKVESGNTKYDSRDGCNAIILKEENTLVSGCKNTIIPNTVTSIGEDAFAGIETLTAIEIPNSVTSIGRYAFVDCQGLTSITLPNSLTSIGELALSYCDNLSSVVIPGSVTQLGKWVFYNSPALKEIHCQIQEPIEVHNQFFSTNTYSEATLYVPTGTKEKYQSTASWNLFTNIVEEEVTAIDRILLGQQGSMTVYDLKGRKINPSQVRKGHVYIVNGKKTVVR